MLTAGKSIEETYQKKTQLEHIILRPDSYIGSTEPLTQQLWVVDESGAMNFREVTFVPGLFKIFDEVLVNASDNKQRDPSMNKLEVTISRETACISVWNNGASLPVVMHAVEKVYVPELVFGHLRTGSNFDDNEKKVTGGRNGFGAKLANIFSHEFIVETNDVTRGLKFRQVFSSNMTMREEPKITKATGKRDYTCVSFKPDLARFKMTCLDDDIVALMKKRVYDMAGVSDKSLKVFLNGAAVPISSFKDYVSLFQVDDTGSATPFVYERLNERWEIGVGVSDGQFRQVSFVNSICTTKGGSHVTAVVDKITDALAEKASKKARSGKGKDIKSFQVKPYVSVYVNCLIENPAFDSQTKETLTTRAKDFGSLPVIPDSLLKRIIKTCAPIVERVLLWASFKETSELVKASGSKKVNLRGIPKLDDANFAGGARAERCTLILTEGDSAKTLAISGLSVVGRDLYGVFPLKGKPLNVRDCGMAKMMENQEIQALVDIVGLKFNVVYTPENIKTLRYGAIMVMADQDYDGSHIKGLIINFIHAYWPSLFRIPGFLCEFITPIVKCTKGKEVSAFYTMPQYAAWQASPGNERGWAVKYYKGLGTSTALEAREYFRDIGRNRIAFSYEGESSDAAIVLAFDKTKADERKEWLRGVEPGTFVDYGLPTMPYTEFVNKELSLYSIADNVRSIPSAIDGLKPSQRKILFGCFRRKLAGEVKVAQLTGYVGEHAMYHHGEVSLANTIVGMAQTFVGSNNINLLYPSGQFGTRLMGGKDAASSRYIFTRLGPLTRLLFNAHDEALLTFLQEDGISIEPEWYLPIIPMVLVNGGAGVGTGWSTDVPPHNPLDLVAAIRSKLRVEAHTPLQPWFRGFTGTVVAKDPTHFSTIGKVSLDVDTATVVITELPVGVWTQTYKAFLETLLISGGGGGSGASNSKKKKSSGGTVATKAKKVSPQAAVETTVGGAGAANVATAAAPAPAAPGGGGGIVVLSVTDKSTEDSILFSIKVSPESVQKLGTAEALIKAFHLEASFTTTNMHLFDADMKIRKYSSAEEILDSFYSLRFDYYARRREMMLDVLAKAWIRLENKMRFLVMVTEGSIVITRPHVELIQQLQAAEFPVLDDDTDYDYLLSIPIRGLTMERVERLRAERDAKAIELEVLRSQTPELLWLHDLDELEQKLKTQSEEAEVALTVSEATSVSASASASASAKPKKRGKAKTSSAAADATKKKRVKTDTS